MARGDTMRRSRISWRSSRGTWCRGIKLREVFWSFSLRVLAIVKRMSIDYVGTFIPLSCESGRFCRCRQGDSKFKEKTRFVKFLRREEVRSHRCTPTWRTSRITDSKISWNLSSNIKTKDFHRICPSEAHHLLLSKDPINCCKSWNRQVWENHFWEKLYRCN